MNNPAFLIEIAGFFFASPVKVKKPVCQKQFLIYKG